MLIFSFNYQLCLNKVDVAARYVQQTNVDQSEASILLHVQQSIYYTSSCGQSICNLNLMPHPIILESSSFRSLKLFKLVLIYLIFTNFQRPRGFLHANTHTQGKPGSNHTSVGVITAARCPGFTLFNLHFKNASSKPNFRAEGPPVDVRAACADHQ